jgi:hypothetical protein
VSKNGTLIKIQLSTLLGRRLENVKRYGWQHSIGATFSRPIDRKISLIPGTPVSMSGNVLRGEFIVEIDRDVNKLVNNNYKVVERNRYAGVLGWDTKIYIPWLTPWNRNKFLGSTTQLFCEWVPNRTSKDIMYPYYPFRKRGHHFSTITESLSYGFWQDRIMPGFYGAYQLDDGSAYYTAMLIFKPTFRWTYMVTYTNYIETGQDTQNLDQVLFDITYEF